MNKKNNIVFMFLGGIPKDIHTTIHYDKFYNLMKKSENFKSLYVVIHPINLENFILDDYNLFWKDMFKNNRLKIVDKNHWIKTEWGTRSLTDATLLMMQSAFLYFGDIFKKYVLLSQNCVPLYNYDILYNEFNKDDLSWFSCMNEMYKGEDSNNHPIKFYKFNGGPFNINTINKQSQWFAADRNHLNLFFNEKNKKLIETYKTVNYERISSTTKIFQSYLDAYSLHDLDNKLIKYDSDNSFFISILSSKIIKTKIDLIKNIRILNKKNIKKYFKNQWIKKKKEKSKYLLRMPSSNSIYKLKNEVYINVIKSTNKKNIKEIYFIYKKNNKKYILKNKKFIEIKSEKKKFITVGYEKGLTLNLYTTPLTYNDYNLFEYSPSNLLRNYNIFLKEKSIIFPSTFDFLHKKTEDAIKIIIQLEKDIDASIYKLETFTVINNVINPHNHPCEFSTYKIQEIINIYNLLIMIDKKIKTEDLLYINAMKKWKKILIKNNAIKLENGYYIINNTDIIMGNKIDSSILNKALCSGSLFIRKVMKESFIHNFSDELYNLKDYVPNLYENMK